MYQIYSLRWQTTPSYVTLFNLPNHIFVIGEARYIKFRVLIDTEEYERVRDYITPKKGCV